MDPREGCADAGHPRRPVLLLALVGGTATLAGCLLGRRLRARQARRHPQQAAVREQTRQARRLAAEWPLLAQTLGLGYRDQWTRQHRFPTAEFVVDDQGVTATVAAIAGAGLADYQRAAGYLADTWGCVTVRAEQQGPGLIRLRGLHRDPLLAPARVDLSGIGPGQSLTSWWLGWAEDSSPVMVRLAEVSGIVVAGLAGFGKTMLVAHLLGQLAPSPAVQFVLVDGKGGPDYDRLIPRAWLSAKDDLDRGPRRAAAGASADGRPPGQPSPRSSGVTDAWHVGPSPSWPLVVVVIDEAHTFFHERKGTSPEVKAHNALVAELSPAGRGADPQGPQRRHPGHAADPAGHRGCHPDPDPGQLPGRHQLRHPHPGRRRGGVGGGDPPAPRRLPGPAERPGLCRGGRDQPARPAGLPPGPDPAGRPPPGRGHHPGHHRAAGAIRPSCWPSRRRGCGSCPTCRPRRGLHDRPGSGGRAAPRRPRRSRGPGRPRL